MIANDNFDVRVLTSACADYASTTTFQWDTGQAGTAHSFRDSNGADVQPRRICNYATFTINPGTFTDATKYLTGPFTNYHWNHGDFVVLTGGTAVVAGPYEVVAKIDNSTVQLAASIAGGGSPADVVGTLYQGTDFREAFVPARTFDEGGILQCEMWGTITGGANNLALTSCTYAEAAPCTITVAGLSAYTFAVGDHVLINSGTGIRVGLYEIGSKPSGTSISLTKSAGAAANAQTDISITIIKAQSVSIVPYVSNPDGSGATRIDAVQAQLANAWLIRYMPSATGTGHFSYRMRIMLTAGQEIATGAVIEHEMRVMTSITASPHQDATWSARHITRTTTSFKRDLNFYFMYFKNSTGADFGMNPKGVMWTHWAPKVVGS